MVPLQNYDVYWITIFLTTCSLSNYFKGVNTRAATWTALMVCYQEQVLIYPIIGGKEWGGQWEGQKLVFTQQSITNSEHETQHKFEMLHTLYKLKIYMQKF